MDVFIEEAPGKLLKPYKVVITEDAIRFVAELTLEFKERIEEVSGHSNFQKYFPCIISFCSCMQIEKTQAALY